MAGSARPPLIGLPHGELHRGGRIGKYEILTLLSVGGMAELFLAFTSGPGGFRKFVVVKRILPDARSNDHSVKMFLDEARITAALNHPNIAQVFDLGDDGGPFLAMEFIAGQNLNQIAKACHARRRKLPIGFTMAVARDLCLALHHAHTFTDAAGKPFPVIHRDVAQKNVMVTYEGAVRLLDFGIAKVRGGLGRTNAGMVKGTTGYMSPEQVRGEELDGRSDVFSVGVMLHEVLTGRRLFAATTEAEEMEHILSAPIPRPSSMDPSIPEDLSDVVMTALARNRADRFPSARALAKALEGVTGATMFDSEQIAEFMRELFSERMAATRALLDSAGDGESAEVRSAASSLIEDPGMTFPEAPRSDPFQHGREDPEAMRTEPIELPATGSHRLAGARWLPLLLILVLLGVALAYLVVKALDVEVPPASSDTGGPPASALPREAPAPE